MSANKNRHQGVGGRHSTRVALSPYFIEDLALKPGELARERVPDIHLRPPAVVTPEERKEA